VALVDKVGVIELHCRKVDDDGVRRTWPTGPNEEEAKLFRGRLNSFSGAATATRVHASELQASRLWFVDIITSRNERRSFCWIIACRGDDQCFVIEWTDGRPVGSEQMSMVCWVAVRVHLLVVVGGRV
jgi:hypothetical protein